MPTIITHSVIALSSSYSFSSGKESLKFWILSIACSSLPDADVIGYRWLYIPSYHFFGHRGFFHSPFFAALLSLFIVCIFYRKEVIFSNRWWKYLLYFFILAASHGLLDALTNGGNGIAADGSGYGGYAGHIRLESGDGGEIRVGERTSVQDNAVLHTTPESPTAR